MRMCSIYETSKTLFNFLFFLSHTFTERLTETENLLFIYMELFFYFLDICYFEMVLHVTGTKKNEEIKQ